MVFPLAIPLALGLGGALGGGKGGGGGGSNAASDVQSQIAQQLFQETDPLRRSLIQRSQNYAQNGVDSSPAFSAFKSVAEPQFAQARENIIGSTPRGGALISALANLEGDRARTLTQGRGAIDEAELARALTLSTGQTGQALGGLGQAASIQAAMAQADADREAGVLGALGTGLGALIGSKV